MAESTTGRRPFKRKTMLADQFQPLRRQVKLPVWGDLGLRLGLALGLLFMVIMIHWWDREGLVDNVDGHISFLDVVYFTMISVTTTGFWRYCPGDRPRAADRGGDRHPPCGSRSCSSSWAQPMISSSSAAGRNFAWPAFRNS